MRLIHAAIALTLIGPAAKAADPHIIDQGWKAEQWNAWYDATQGSRLIPLAWLQALEQAGSTAPFLDESFMGRLGYLPRGNGLPLGFAVDKRDDEALGQSRLRWSARQGSGEPWVGMNCSACHTGQITYRGQEIRIDGGAALTDFQSLLEALDSALAQTQSDPAKWERFASRVLGDSDTAGNRAMLRGAVAQLAEWQAEQRRLNRTQLRYGFGRLDAFGHIFNKVTAIADPARPTPNPADAPVSYPYLWGVGNLPRVQYNAIAQNLPFRGVSGATFDIGALGRNTGEVIGVFADVVARPRPGPIAGYESSVDVRSLVALEQLLMKLRPPAWPTALFGTPDPALVAEGQRQFQLRCASCHLQQPASGNHEMLDERFSYFVDASAAMTGKGVAPGDRNRPPGTDPWMACNAFQRTSKTGVMQGLSSGYIPGKPPLPAVAPLAELLGTTVAAVLAGNKGEVVRSATATYFGGDLPPHVVPLPGPFVTASVESREDRLRECMAATSAILGYKSRPLAGIWATPPYLHNGSVPTLDDLLRAPAERPKWFDVGSREYDPEKLGFRAVAGANSFRFDTVDTSGAAIPGNSKEGHDYDNASILPEDRKALLEYLKTQ